MSSTSTALINKKRHLFNDLILQIYLIILMMNLFTLFVGSFRFLLNYEYEKKTKFNKSINPLR